MQNAQQPSDNLRTVSQGLSSETCNIIPMSCFSDEWRKRTDDDTQANGNFSNGAAAAAVPAAIPYRIDPCRMRGTQTIFSSEVDMRLMPCCQSCLPEVLELPLEQRRELLHKDGGPLPDLDPNFIVDF